MPENAIAITQDELRGEQYILDCWKGSPDMIAEMNWLAAHYGVTEAWETWANAGYNDGLNTELPLAQTMMGMWLLTHASDDLSTYLEAARLSAMSLLKDTRWAPNAGGPNAIATTHGTSYVDLHDSFRYESVICRAATLWHEAIHMSGDPHDAFFPEWSDLFQTDLANGQADEYFGTGAYSGSTTYLVDYIANATAVSPLLRALARQRANWELDNCFAQHPGFSVGMPSPLVGDFDANNFTDFAVYRPATGHWHIRPNNTIAAAEIDLDWGQPTDIPVPGRYSAEGVLDYGLYRPSTGYWRIKSGVNGSTEAIQWGAPEDIPVPGDFDGDGFTDLAVWRPSTGCLYNRHGDDIQLGRAGDIPAPGHFYAGVDGAPPPLCFAVFRPTTTCHWRIWRPRFSDIVTLEWGRAGDIPVPGDYDGDGLDELAVWRPSNGKWYMHIWGTDQMYVEQWGQAGDIPIPGVTGWLFYRRLMQDLDGDGRTDPGFFRRSSQRWAVYNLATHKSAPRPDWPVESGEVIVPADYNGDGRMEYATWRPRDGMWRWYDDLEGQAKSSQWGQSGDIPVPADYDGDGRAEAAIWKPYNGHWWFKKLNADAATGGQQWGTNGDFPVPGDYDGDGRMDIAVWRPSNGKWYILYSSTGESKIFEYGRAGDVPIAATPWQKAC